MEEKKNTFSKSLLSVVLFLYFIGATIGAFLIILSAVVDVRTQGQIDPSMFIAYSAYLAAPTSVAIAFYAWKSKAENLLKIQKSQGNAEVSSIVQTLSQMGGNL